VSVWDAPSGELLATFQAHNKAVTALAIAADGSLLATGGADGIVHVWDVAAALDVARSSGGGGGAGGGASGGGGGGGGGGSGGAALASFSAHSLAVTALAWTTSLGAAARLVSASTDRTVRVWDVAARRALGLTSLPSGVAALALAPAEDVLYVGALDGAIYVVDLVAAAAWAASGSRAGAHTGAAAAGVVGAGGGAPRASTAPLLGHTSSVSCLAISADGLRLVSGADDGTVRLWDAAARAPLGTSDLHRSAAPITSLAILPRRPASLLLSGRQGVSAAAALAAAAAAGSAAGGGGGGGGVSAAASAALAGLVPVAPLRKRANLVPLSAAGSAVGPLDALVITGLAPSLGAAEGGAAGGGEAARQRALDSALALLACADAATKAGGGGAASGASGEGGAGEEASALRARIAELEKDNARWKAVNNKLLARVK
jgi:hypothetical protein